ncbi:beta-1,6-N-acetylglucosaminyltransferase [Cribrihabitans neustonicus]|uniref:DUF5927 domain-containing protein n=1 Tax=Cribrihabitans neustonicus TaxID=1429085 RepID=UPI003B5C1A2E
MSALGVVMLVHTALARAAEAARHWSAAGCPVVIHVDKSVRASAVAGFQADMEGDPLIRFSPRHRCEWGTWGIVAATQDAAGLLLADFPAVRHVYLASGSCLPVRPVQDLAAYLAARPGTDFIESATTADVPWITGGLGFERFTLRFPFSWKRQRRLFDGYVSLQRRLGTRRRIPEGLVPHMGSQWWCLTRQTLAAILNDPRRGEYDAYFRRVWIPDESYFQSLARLHSTRIESRSLTLAKFDPHGRPYVFYDDHLPLLRRSQCFVARKIWPEAHTLYNAFPAAADGPLREAEPDPGKISRLFDTAAGRLNRGRSGLYMQSRFPRRGREHGITPGPYAVFQGFTDLFENFEDWLSWATGARVHGHLFAPEGAEFAGGDDMIAGALSADPVARDYDCERFLTNFLWNTRGARQYFQYGPRDSQGANWLMARDPNARIALITGAWALPLFRSARTFAELRREAARLQQAEAAQLEILRAHGVQAQVRIWSLAEFLEAPEEHLQTAVAGAGLAPGRILPEPPELAPLDGVGAFLQRLKDDGMHPYLLGDFPAVPAPVRRAEPKRKPYLVR